MFQHYKKCFNTKIRKLDSFRKDHVTLNTEVMVLKIQLCHHTNKFILKCIKIQNNLYFNNISHYFYCIFDQINAVL